MSVDELPTMGRDEIAFHLELTPPQLKVTHTALKVFFDGLGHDEAEVRDAVRAVLAKLPDEHTMRAVRL